MPIPGPRQTRRSESEPYIEERTCYSNEKNADGLPDRAYHVRRVDVGGGWSYEVTMEVIAKRAAEDILGRDTHSGETTRDIWGEIWNTP